MHSIYTYLLACTICLLACSNIFAQSLTFSGSSRKIIEVEPERNTGLDKIFVVYDTDGVSASYTATSSDDVVWYRYSNLGGGFAEEITDIVKSGNTYTLSKLQGDMGYIVEDGTNRSYYWVTGYKPHELTLRSATVSAESDCSMTILNINGTASPIHYYTITGQQRTLDRDIIVEYNTLQPDRENRQFTSVVETKHFEAIDDNGCLYISPSPLTDTDFTISGDTFMRQWGSYSQCHTDTYITPAVDSFVYADQAPHTSGNEASNEITSGDEGTLGGSAPADITFTAVYSDAILHHEWQFANDEEFEDITYRFNDSEINYIFRDEGITYVRYIGSNADGSCQTYSETFVVSIGASELKCPNAFSPGASEGVNDIWKVSYRSIIEFECHIFNRQGEEIFSFNDPSQGWDGTRRGKLVKPGVYFYVIEALGADGKQYKKSGDINILRYTRRANGSTTGGEGGVTGE